MHECTAQFYETHNSLTKCTVWYTSRTMLSCSAKRVSASIIVQTIQTNIYIGLDGWTEMPRKWYNQKASAICSNRLTDLPQSVRRFSSTAEWIKNTRHSSPCLLQLWLSKCYAGDEWVTSGDEWKTIRHPYELLKVRWLRPIGDEWRVKRILEKTLFTLHSESCGKHTTLCYQTQHAALPNATR